MFVGDSAAAPGPAAAVGKDELKPRPPTDEGRPARDRRPRQDFRAALLSPHAAGGAAGAEAETATAATMAGWFRAEVSQGSPSRTPAVAPPRPVDRVLIGGAGDSAEARIQIGTGALAGTEIRLQTAPGGGVIEAQLLTRVDGSRQTLSVVMDEIAARLRGKGITLQVNRSAVRRDRDERGDRGERGEATLNVASFDLASCPAVSARSAQATRATLRACAMLPERWDAELPPLGAAAIALAGIDSDAWRAEDIELALRFGAGAGRVAVDPLFASRVVDRVLGGRAMLPTVIRALGPAERGVLAAVLAPMWDRLGATVDLAAAPARTPDVAAIVIRIEAGDVVGHVRLTPAAHGGFWSGKGDAVWGRARAGCGSTRMSR